MMTGLSGVTHRAGINPSELGIYLALWWDMLNVVKGGS